MNFHPLFVHFPIAFWTIYSILELVRFKRILKLPYWFYIKGGMIATGTIASFATLWSGLFIESMFASPIVTVHKRVAITTIVIYTLVAVHYLLTWIEKDFYSFLNRFGAIVYLIKLNNFLFQNGIIVFLAIIGLILITLTGALGGIIAFGPGVDPITEVVYQIFFRNEAY